MRRTAADSDVFTQPKSVLTDVEMTDCATSVQHLKVVEESSGTGTTRENALPSDPRRRSALGSDDLKRKLPEASQCIY